VIDDLRSNSLLDFNRIPRLVFDVSGKSESGSLSMPASPTPVNRGELSTLVGFSVSVDQGIERYQWFIL
jgi:hypothetical protein